VRTEVRLRPGQETSLAPSCLHLRYFGSKRIALKRKLATFLRLFGAPSDSAPEALCFPRYAPAVTLRDKVRSCEICIALNVEPLGPVVVWNQQNYLKLMLTVRYSKFSYGCCPRNPP